MIQNYSYLKIIFSDFDLMTMCSHQYDISYMYKGKRSETLPLLIVE